MRPTVRRLLALGAALALVAGLAACGEDDPVAGDDAAEEPAGAPTDPVPAEGQGPAREFTDPELAAEVLERTPPQPEGVAGDVAPDALEITTLIQGRGEGLQAGDLVVAHYAGVLADGTPFDDSWARGQPFEVTIGEGFVIPGWDQGLIGAKIGERRRLVIGYELAYGAAGSPPTIPERAPLIFEIDVVDIVRAGS